MPDPGFFTFVVNLVKLGGLGVGALIFVMVFLILLRNQPADERTAKLRTGFLQWGAVFAILALVASSEISVLHPAEIAEARINYGGRGDITRVQKTPAGQSLIERFSPF